jgi:3-methyladenine DNA glycosylase AlkD
LHDVNEMAAGVDGRIRSLPVRNAENVRRVRREVSGELKGAEPEYVLALARKLVEDYGYRGVAYELIYYHKDAYASLTGADLAVLGRGMSSWAAVDSFARILSGPAWRDRLIGDELVHEWAGSSDRWWRRAALVSTVALNVRSHGGKGDADRTLAVCRRLVDDHDDMVLKAMSWALRELVVHDPEAVETFLAEYEDRLAARARREVRNKLATGLKNPPKHAKGPERPGT